MTNSQAATHIAEYLQCMDTKALAAAARGEVDLAVLLRAELASRGMGLAGVWIGFNQAAAVMASAG